MKSKDISSQDIYFSYRIDISEPQFLFESHCHSSYEILYIRNGEGRYMVEGSSFPVSSGTLMVNRPFEYHMVEIKNISEEMPYERFVIHFSDKSLVNEAAILLNKILESDETSGKYYTPLSLSSDVVSLIERFDLADKLPDDEKKVYLKILLSELIVLLSVCGGEHMTHKEADLGARVIRYLNDNITKNISLDKLAKKFFVSKYYLCRAFKKHNGISVHGYINHKRVMYAKQLIESGETASGAAYKVGFGDYSAFYRAYVKTIGKAPTSE